MRACIRSQSERLCADGLADAVRFGCDTDEVADGVGILRNNASKELNALFEEGALVKISGRPVRFLDKDVLERTLGLSLPTSFFPSKDAFSGFLAQSGARTQHAGGQDAFRRFMFRHGYHSEALARERTQAAFVLKELFGYYMENFHELPQEFIQRESRWGRQQAVVDYVAGLTDSYAVQLFKEIFVPPAEQMV